MKRITAIILSALMILACVPVMTFAGRFEDVSDGKWYSEGISFCAANGYMAGTSESIFDRNGTLTRAMFMTILAKIDGVDLASYEGRSSFTDVKTDGWYTAAIEWAYQNKLASGIADGVFGYKNPVTREQMALFLYAYAEHVNSTSFEVTVPDVPIEYSAPVIDTAPRADLSVFADSDRVHAWARDAMEWAVACGLFSGVGEGYLDPRGNCTRAQAAVLIRAFVLNFLSDCEHEWTEATCTDMSVCTKCELRNATELGHDFPAHLCTESVKCSRCDEMTKASDHILTELSCTEDSMCIVCGYVDAEALGHTTSNGICERCGEGIFPDAHQQLRYFIEANGTLDELGLYRFVYSEKVENVTIEVSVTNETYDKKTISLQMIMYDSENDIYYRIGSGFDNSSPAVCNISSYMSITDDPKNPLKNKLYDLNGGFIPANVNSNGDFVLYSFNDFNYGIGNEAVEITKTMLATMLFISDVLIQENAGVSLSDFGFNMTSFYE